MKCMEELGMVLSSLSTYALSKWSLFPFLVEVDFRIFTNYFMRVNMLWRLTQNIDMLRMAQM